MNDIDWKRQVDFGRVGIVFGVLLLFFVFSLVNAKFGPKPPKVLADTSPRCANKKLPSYFVSDPHIVRKMGGKAMLYVEGADENFGIGAPPAMPSGGDGSTPANATAVSPEPSGGAYGTGTMGMTTIGRPDSGTLLLAIAQTEQDRETGLMCVTQMAPRVGMIFVFSSETVENFWMKDTLIPLDMVFVTSDGVVSTVAANVPSSRIDQPESTLARRAGLARFVIELNAGEAARDDIKPGSKLEIPHLVSLD